VICPAAESVKYDTILQATAAEDPCVVPMMYFTFDLKSFPSMTGHGFFGMLALPHVVRIAQREAAVNDVLENRNPNEMQYTGAAVDGTTGAPCHQ
jgi:hypothetical protein